MTDWVELDRALARLLDSGRVEVHEDGELLAELAGLRYELRPQGPHAILHLWSEERNLARRVLRWDQASADRIRLEVQRFGRSRPGRLEFFCGVSARRTAGLTRQKFRALFRRFLAEQFPDEEVDSLTASSDLEHSFSGSYVRGVMRRGGQAWGVLGVSGAEDAATIDASLSFGLLWLDWAREHARRRVVAGLRLILPTGTSLVTAHRLRAIAPSANVELYELDEAHWRAQRVDPADAGNLATWLTPRREVERTLEAARAAVARVCALAPQAIDAVVPPGTTEVALRFRGLEFARWQRGRVFWGLPEKQRELTDQNWSQLEEFVRRLDTSRHPLASDTNHPLYRAQAERWLESLALADPARLDAHLDPRFLYPQVPAFSAGDRGVIDLLGVTRDGRLAVLELKVAEQIHLVLQAVDYWLRVSWHHRQGDLARYGYFPGVELQAQPPRLCLVAPGFRFHSATDVLLRYLVSEIEVVRIGLNETWRRGLRVVFRQ